MFGLSGSKVCHEWLWQLLLRCHLMLWRWWLIEESHDRVLRHLRRCWRRLRFGVLAAKTPVRVQVKQVALTFAENEVVMLVLRTSWLYYESAFSFCEKYKYLLEITYWTNTNKLFMECRWASLFWSRLSSQIRHNTENKGTLNWEDIIEKIEQSFRHPV